MSDLSEHQSNAGNTVTMIDPIVQPGAWLKAERIKRGKSLQELADSLRLRSHQLEALEADDHARLPGPTFVRGFIRNYARELGIDSSVVLGAPISHSASSQPLSGEHASPLNPLAPNTVGGRLIEPVSQNIRFEAIDAPPHGGASKKVGFLVIIAAILAACAYLGYGWYVENYKSGAARTKETQLIAHSGSTSELQKNSTTSVLTPANSSPPTLVTAPLLDTQPNLSSSLPITPPNLAPNPGSSSPKQEFSQQTSAQLAASAAAALAAQKLGAQPAMLTTALPTAVTTAANAPTGRLQFEFSDDAWIEIRSTTGKVIHKRMHPKGSKFDFDGGGKLALVIGNAKSVKLSQRGAAIDLPKFTQVAVARLSLD